MKAERRHELKTNTLATKIVQLPDVGRKWAGRAALGLAIVLAVAALVYNRISTSRQAEIDAADDIAQARAALDEIRNANPGGFKPFDAAYMNTIKEKRKLGMVSLDEAASRSTDPKLRAQGLLLRGDIDFALASTPSLPGSATQPALQMDPSRESLLAEASDAYKELLQKYAEQPVNVASAHMALAAIAENKSDWGAADEQYQAVIKDPDAPPNFKDAAVRRASMLPALRQPVLLPLKDSDKLVANPSATQSSTQPIPATGPTTAPTTAPATAPATQSAATQAVMIPNPMLPVTQPGSATKPATQATP